MQKNTIIARSASGADFNTPIIELQSTKNVTKMNDSKSENNDSETNDFYNIFPPPEGMRWDSYGNSEFIDE